MRPYKPGMLGADIDPSYGYEDMTKASAGSQIGSTASSKAGADAASAGGSSMGGAAIMGGATALSGMMQALYAQEMDRQRRIQEAQMNQSNIVGQNGQNQQQMLAQLMGGYKTALGV